MFTQCRPIETDFQNFNRSSVTRVNFQDPGIFCQDQVDPKQSPELKTAGQYVPDFNQL